MARAGADARGVLEVVACLYDDDGPDPVPLPAIVALQRLLGADTGAGYVEVEPDGRTVREWTTRPIPEWLDEQLARVGTQDPLHRAHRLPVGRALAISDLLDERRFRRLELFEAICEPLEVGDSMRIYLAAPPGSVRFLFFDRRRRGFPLGARGVLEALAPHLAAAPSRRARAMSHPAVLSALPLTPAEREVATLVSRGLRNAEVAARRRVSVKAVEQHLGNVYRKLGVRSRAELIARHGAGLR